MKNSKNINDGFPPQNGMRKVDLLVSTYVRDYLWCMEWLKFWSKFYSLPPIL